MKRIAILGSTGSVGANALDVAAHLKDQFEVIGLSADSNIRLLSRQANRFRSRIVCVGDVSLAKKIKSRIPAKTKIVCEEEGLQEIVSRNDIDLIVFAISGSSCLAPLLKAVENKKEIALANKESLVSGGHLVMRAARRNNIRIIPIDSEHSAIFQCLEGRERFLLKIYLTGSGGPLLNVPRRRFDSLSRNFILRHPRWRMGKKISVDSATMMNKGLEIIEAKWLFGVEESAIEVLIHPEAVIHSMVELIDGSVFAQLAVPDMRIPIQYALTYPARSKTATRCLDFSITTNLTFQKPDERKFPCLRFARETIKKGLTYPAVLNAADEEAVRDYLEGKIKFSDIPSVIEKVLSRHRPVRKEEPSLGDIFEAECWAKEEARSLCYH